MKLRWQLDISSLEKALLHLRVWRWICLDTLQSIWHYWFAWTPCSQYDTTDLLGHLAVNTTLLICLDTLQSIRHYWFAWTPCSQYDTTDLLGHLAVNMTLLICLDTLQSIWHYWFAWTPCSQYETTDLLGHLAVNMTLLICLDTLQSIWHYWFAWTPCSQYDTTDSENRKKFLSARRVQDTIMNSRCAEASKYLKLRKSTYRFLSDCRICYLCRRKARLARVSHGTQRRLIGFFSETSVNEVW